MLAVVHLDLIAITLASILTGLWAWSLKQTNERIAALESTVAELQQALSSS
ncbi:hypothetical protein [Lacipirellula sp.]|uniref:hypothetical protein n=1 Tax=Lacipirellula sp. TaxID=2691419 RepID=UPI003D0B76F1